MEKLDFFADKKQSVFDAIIEHKKTLNFSMLKTALRKKDIKINDKKIHENCDVQIGDKVTIYLSERQKKKIDIVYEDENIIVANKPQGIETTTLDKAYFDSQSLEELLNAKACHRLDKNTEGLIVLAKNKNTEQILFDVFKNHEIEKIYQAIVFGKVNKNGENFADYIKKEQNFAKICKKNDKNSKMAKLSYKLLKQKNNLSLIEVNLETGRTHQIRAQLSHHGIFVLGDEKYGDKQVNKKYHKSKQELCATRLKFLNLPAPLEYLSNRNFEITPSFDIENIT